MLASRPPAQLARNCHDDDADRQLLADRRGDRNRFGTTLQMVTPRFVGPFLADPTDVPAGVIAHFGAQLDPASTTELMPYQVGDARWDHAAEIRQRFGYREFAEQPEHFRLVQWLAEPAAALRGPTGLVFWRRCHSPASELQRRA